MHRHPFPRMARAFLLSWLLIVASTFCQAQEVDWAIAIHGGASDPTDWDDATKSLRREGLKRALEKGRKLLADGATALDVVETVIRTLEDDPNFNAGRGAVLTKAGRAELDASMMDGRTRACGAVAGVTVVKNPIQLARRVMTETRHVLLAGSGAEQFAKQNGLELVDPNYFLTQNGRNRKNYFGTVGCVVVDSQGNLAAGTSTGGTDNKLPGRIGDSPIIGAGTYADNATCAVSGTGIGEEYIRNSIAYDVSAQMKYSGKSLAEAIATSMQTTLKPNVGGLISVSAQGEIVLQHNTAGMSCGAADSTGRFEIFLKLPESQYVSVSTTTAKQQIRDMLIKQSDAWNAGDIDTFMKPYWNNEKLTFTSGGNVTRGYDATLKRYKLRYPDQRTMGRLTFSDLEFVELGGTGMQVMGVWKLDRDDPVGGRFTLVLHKFANGWKIIHDHTSVQQP